MAVDIREAVLAALEFEGEAFVVHSEEVEDGGLEVMDVNFVGGDFEAEVVAGAVGVAGFETAAGHHDGEDVGVVVATEVFAFGGAAFAEGCAAEFPTPDNESVFEESALFEVSDEGGDRFVHGRTFVLQSITEGGSGTGSVEIPAPVEEVDKANAFLDEASCQQAVVGEAGAAGLGSVGFQCLLGFFGNVHDFRDGGLHPVGHLVLSNTGEGFGAAEFFGLDPIQGVQGIETLAAKLAGESLGVGNVKYGVAFGATLDSLENTGKKAAAKGVFAAIGLHSTGDQGYEGGEVLVFGA